MSRGITVRANERACGYDGTCQFDSKPYSFKRWTGRERVMAMKATDNRFNGDHTAQGSIRVADLPRNNPCAQCFEPIALPAWVETDGRRASYLWQCGLCNYRFETIVFFAEAVDQDDALAA
jgi:hypothetical protein